MPFYILDIGFDDDFELIGIVSHQKDYRLAWSINKTMKWELYREADIVLDFKNQQSVHACFVYTQLEEGLVYHLIDNKTENGFLLPELSQFDYVLKIDSASQAMDDQFYKQLRSAPFVQAVFPIDKTKVKSKQNLFYQQGEI